MAKDDLSVNIGVGVNLDKASLDNANAAMATLEANIDRLTQKAKGIRADFKTEFQKELGFGPGTNVQIGGYSPSAVKSSSKNLKNMSVDTSSGFDPGALQKDAKASIMRNANEFAESLAQMLGMQFVNEFAKTTGEKEFKIAELYAAKKGSVGSPQYQEALQKATEDFIVTAANNVVISPEMAMAAMQRVIEKNPGAYLESAMWAKKPMATQFQAAPAIDGANYDEKVTQSFNNFLDQAVGADSNAASKVSALLESKLKVMFSKIIDEGQKAREKTFSGAIVSEGEDAAENLIRYADDAARKAIARMEEKLGLQAGTTAMFAPGMIPEKFASKPNAKSDPQALLSVLVGEYQDDVTKALMASVPDPKAVASPIAQVLANPYILGDKFATEYEKEITKALTGKAKAAGKAVEASAPTMGGGAVNPDINALRKYLTEQKALVESQGKTFMAGLDTEFNSQIDEKLTELGLVIKDGTGKFVEIFKFLQLPNDLQAMQAGWEKLPAGARMGQAKNAADLAKRGEILGIPTSAIGVPDNAEANFIQFRDKIAKLVDVLKILSDLGIQLTGSNFKGAEAANIKKAIDYVNTEGAKRGLDPLATPELSNVFDPAALAKKLSDSSPTLAKIFDSPEAKSGISGALGHLIKNIASQFPGFIQRYSEQFRMDPSGKTFEYNAKGGPAQAHFALSDAAASIIVKDFVEEFGNDAATLLVPVAKDLNTKIQAAAGGSGGNKPPTTPTGAADKPGEDPFSDRAAQNLQRLLLVGKKYEMAVAGLTENELAKVQQRLQILKQSEGHAELLAKIAEKELKRSQIMAEMAQLSNESSGFARDRRALGQLGPQGPLTQGDAAAAKRYNEQTKAASLLQTEIRELEMAGQNLERQTIQLVKEQSRQGQVSEALTQNMRKEIDATYENTQAGKSATAQIKTQMQEQVNAQKAVQKQTQSLMNTWVTSRYALYDIGNFYQNVAQNLIRVSRQIFNTTQSYRRFETSFTSVERAMQLTQEGAVDLRDQFISLSETIPVSFEEISRIATLGAQMGIAADGIVGFTETVAQFASITGISADTVAQKFGKIAELADVDPTQFNNLGSAVAFAGINAVATESEILTLSESIAAVSNQVGITAPEIIGMATALASVGIPAEQARGVFTRVFADIDRAASTGGKSLQALAEVSGMSAETIASSWGTEGAANEVFISLLKGLDASDNLTAAFDKLNIVETREINTLTRLAKNLDVVQQALGDAGVSFDAATFLGDSFEKTVDNLDSKITLFKSNLDSFLASLTAGMAQGLGTVLDFGSQFLKFLKGAEDSMLFKSVLPIGLALTVAGAAFAAIAAVVAKTTAQVYAFRVAMINAANDPTAVTGFARQIKQLTGFGSGIIEMRDQIVNSNLREGINQRGLVEPVNYSKILGGEKAQQAELLKTRNIYLSLGNAVKNTDAARAAGAVTNAQLARLEADAVTKALTSKNLEMQALMASEKASDVARAQRLQQEALYVTFINGEAKVIRESNLRAYERLSVSKLVTEQKRQEAAAAVSNATAVNLETKAAAGGIGKIGTLASRFLGLATVILTVITVVDMLGAAMSKVGNIDLAESGGGLESLREAIKKDTQAIKAGTMDAVATAQVEYKTYKTEVDDTAEAIKKITGINSKAAGSFSKVTEEVKKQTVALGVNTKEWLANAIFNNPELKKWRKEDPLALDKIQKNMAALGISFDQIIADFVAASQGADIDPLAGLNEQLDILKARKQELIDAANASQIPGANEEAITSIQLQINEFEKVKTLLDSIGVTIQGVFSDTALWGSIKSALGLDGVENGILGVVDAFKKASETGKGMGRVVAKVKKETIAQFKEIEGLTPELRIAINSQETVQGIYDVVNAMILAKEAAPEVTEALNKVGSSAMWAGVGSIVARIAGTEDEREILNSLKAILSSTGKATTDLGDAAESAADKIARLISEANAGVTGIMNFRESIRALGKSMAENKGFSLNTSAGAANTQAILSVLDAIGTKAGNSTKKAINNMKVFKLVLKDMGAPQAAIRLVNNAIRALGGVINITAKQAKKLRKEFAALFATFETNLSAGATEVLDQVEKKVRTLSDYVNDLQSVLQAAFDFRYAKTIALDAIANSWISIQESAKSAKDAIQSANAEINEAVANRAVLEYQLSVAERYNDEKRAAVIRAKLAKLDQEIIDKQEQLAEANEQANTTLTGNSKAAINNRAKIRDLVTQYNAYLIALANSGASSETLKSEAAKLEKEFLDQGIAMGFAQDELDDYTQAFKGDFTTVLNGVPRDITVNVNTDPALRAIEEFVAKANEALSGINNPTLGESPTTEPTTPGYNGSRPGPEKDGTFVGQIGPQGNFIWDGIKWVSRKKANRAVPPAGPDNPGKYIGDIGPKGNYIWDGDYWLKRAKGGMVFGPGGPNGDRIPTLLSSGEFVVRAGAVKAYGPDFMNALNQQRVSFMPAGAMSTQGGGGSSVVYLSPEDRALLRAAVDRPIALYTENTKIAQSANAGNMILAQRGSN